MVGDILALTFGFALILGGIVLLFVAKKEGLASLAVGLVCIGAGMDFTLFPTIYGTANDWARANSDTEFRVYMISLIWLVIGIVLLLAQLFLSRRAKAKK